MNTDKPQHREEQEERPKRLTREEFEAVLDAIGEYSHKIPDLPLEAIIREGIYRDHD